MSKLVIKNRYGVTPDDILNDKTLSLKAKGLFGYIQSKPENWSFSVKKITSQNRDGVDSIKSAIKELEDRGLLKRIPVRDSDGKWSGYDYVLSIKPIEDMPLEENPLADNGATYSNTDNSNTDISNTDRELAKQSFAGKDINELIDKFKNVNPNYRMLFENKTERRALEWLVKQHGVEKIGNLIDILPKVVVQKFAPKITRPTELKRDLAKLLLFIKQNQSKGRKIII